MKKATKYEWIKTMSFDELVDYFATDVSEDDKEYKQALKFYKKWLKEPVLKKLNNYQKIQVMNIDKLVDFLQNVYFQAFNFNTKEEIKQWLLTINEANNE